MELYRVFFQKKIVIGITILFVLNLIIAIFMVKEDTKRIDVVRNAEEVVSKAASMQCLEVFESGSTFTKNNILKTEKDFKRLQSVVITDREMNAISSWKANPWSVMFMLMAVGLVVLALIEPSDLELKRLLYLTCRGREGRDLRKLGALVVCVGILVTCFQISALLLMFVRFKEDLFDCMFDLVQTAPGFENYTVIMPVFCYIFWHILEHIVLFASLSVFLWFLFDHMNHLLIAEGIFTSVIIIEFLLFRCIPGGSTQELWKFCNVWYFLSHPEAFTEYRNVDVLGFACGQRSVFYFGLLCILCIGVILTWWIGKRRYPSVMSKKRPPLRITEKCWDGPNRIEAFKLFVCRKGFLLVFPLLMILFMFYSPVDLKKGNVQKRYESFIDMHTSESIRISESDLRELGKKIEQVKTKTRKAESRYERGEIDTDAYLSIKVEYNNLRDSEKLYEILMNQFNLLCRLKKESGIDGEWVDLYLWNRLLGRGKWLFTWIVLLISVLLGIAVFWQEKTAGMDYLIRQTINGRGRLERRKILLIVGQAFLLLLLQEILAVIEVSYSYHLSGFFAPVQSVPDYSGVVLHVSILDYMILTFIDRNLIVIGTVLLPYGIYCVHLENDG